MPIRFLLDEHLRGPLWHAIQRHNLRGGLAIDAVRVGDAPELPRGSDDSAILLWAEREQRILIAEDRETMAEHQARHLRAGDRLPGVFAVILGCTIADMVTILELVAHAGEPADHAGAITYAP
jgi:hypothetical protein